LNPLAILNSQPWIRPALGLLTAIAVLVKYVAPEHTIANQIAGKVLDFLAPLVAMSVGKSHEPAGPMTPEKAASVLKSVSRE
jgi:hypothetical protein